jgi:hypothetical protein
MNLSLKPQFGRGSGLVRSIIAGPGLKMKIINQAEPEEIISA